MLSGDTSASYVHLSPKIFRFPSLLLFLALVLYLSLPANTTHTHVHAHAEKHESQKPSPAIGAAVAAKARPTTVDLTAKPKKDDSAGYTDMEQGLDSPAIDAKAKAPPSGHGEVAVTSETQPATFMLPAAGGLRLSLIHHHPLHTQRCYRGFINEESSLSPREQVAQKIEHLDYQLSILALQKINHPYARLALQNTKAFPRLPANSPVCGESSDSISFNRDSPVSGKSSDSISLKAKVSRLAKEREQLHEKIKHLDHQLATWESSREAALPRQGP